MGAPCSGWSPCTTAIGRLGGSQRIVLRRSRSQSRRWTWTPRRATITYGTWPPRLPSPVTTASAAATTTAMTTAMTTATTHFRRRRHRSPPARYHKRPGQKRGRDDGTLPRGVKSPNRCIPTQHSGKTRGATPDTCLYFARGGCHLGHRCGYVRGRASVGATERGDGTVRPLHSPLIAPPTASQPAPPSSDAVGRARHAGRHLREATWRDRGR